MHAFAATQNCLALMHNSKSIFCEEDLAPCVAECHHTNKGVQRQAWDDVDKAHRSGKNKQIQHGSKC